MLICKITKHIINFSSRPSWCKFVSLIGQNFAGHMKTDKSILNLMASNSIKVTPMTSYTSDITDSYGESLIEPAWLNFFSQLFIRTKYETRIWIFCKGYLELVDNFWALIWWYTQIYTNINTRTHLSSLCRIFFGYLLTILRHLITLFSEFT